MATSPTKPFSFTPMACSRVRPCSRMEGQDINDVMVTYRYRNRTNTDIYVSRRDGIRLKVEPTDRLEAVNEFSIFVSYTAKRAVINEMLSRLNDSPDALTDEKRQIAQAFRKTLHKERSGVVCATVEYMVRDDAIVQAGGRVYLTDVDVVLEWPEHRSMPHPYSRSEQEKSTLAAMLPGAGSRTFAFMLKAVDNSGMRHFTDRYVNLGGKVYRVPTERDEAFSTGVHVVTRIPVAALDDDPLTGSGGELTSKWHSFEEADKLYHLHRTVEDATMGGPLGEVIKEHLNEQAARHRLQEGEQKGQQLVLERELQTLRNANARLKVEQDSQVHHQRTFMEWVKVCATVLTTGIALLTAVQKFATI